MSVALAWSLALATCSLLAAISLTESLYARAIAAPGQEDARTRERRLGWSILLLDARNALLLCARRAEGPVAAFCAAEAPRHDALFTSEHDAEVADLE